MKIIQANTGGIIITKDDSTFLYKVSSNFSIKRNPLLEDSIIISSEEFTNRNSNNSTITLTVSQITEVYGQAFSGTVEDLISAIDVAIPQVINIDPLNVNVSTSVSLEGFKSIAVDETYEAFSNSQNKNEIILVKTIVSGSSFTKLFYKTTVADSAAFDILWIDRASQTYISYLDII